MRRFFTVYALLGLFCSACGTDDDLSAQATVNGALWTEFDASVSQSAGLLMLQLDPNGTQLAGAQRQEVWHVDAMGAASYVQILHYQDPKLPLTQQMLAQQTLNSAAFVAFKNQLGRFQVFGWQDVYPCSGGPTCAEVEETTVLEVNLNGAKKMVAWQTSSLGVPPEARRMAQVIRDAV